MWTKEQAEKAHQAVTLLVEEARRLESKLVYYAFAAHHTSPIPESRIKAGILLDVKELQALLDLVKERIEVMRKEDA